MGRVEAVYVLTGFTIVRETDNAVQVQRDGDDDDEREWIPFSQIREIVREPGKMRIVMTEWIAQKKGFIE